MIYNFLLLLLFSFLSGQSVQIAVDKNNLHEGDFLTLEVEARNSKDFPELNLNVLRSDFDIISGPNQQTNIQFINGRRSSIKKLSWTLSPKKSGRLFIPKLKGYIDDKRFEGNSIEINVYKQKVKSSSHEVFIKTEMNKEKSFIGEQITLTLKLYKKDDLKITSIDEFAMPDFRGFWVEELFNPQRLKYQKKIEIINGIKYQVANLGQRALFPMPANEHIISSINVKVGLEVQKKRNKRDPFFDPFFSSYFTDSKIKMLRTDEIKIKINPFPIGKPNNFTGAVGIFNLSSKVDVNRVNVNEGITFTITLEGTGNLNFFSFPEIIFPDNIEVFQPNETFEKDVFRDQLTGKKSIEYILIPRQKGEFILPKITLSYFNLNNNKWDKVSSQDVKIFVKGMNKKDNSDNITLDNNDTKIFAKDIRYLSNKLNMPNPFITKNVILLIYIISFLFLIIPFLLKKFEYFSFLDTNKKNQKNAKKLVLKFFKNKEPQLYDKIISGLYLFLKYKLNLASKNLDQDQIKSLLNGKIEQNLIDELIGIISNCEEVKFSDKVQIADPHLLEKAILIIEKLDKEL